MSKQLNSGPRILGLTLLEIRRFRRPTRPLILIALALLPSLYAVTYLWANWDPYGKTETIPVAVVNTDVLAHTSDGQRVNAGADAVDQLRANPLFDWRFVSGSRAAAGLRNGDYYFAITIPREFSARLASADTSDPNRGVVHIEGNDANNYVAGIMAEATQSKLEDQINTAVHAAYVRAIYGELSGVQDQLSVAADGAHRLVAATQTAQRGANALLASSRTVAAGTHDLAAGARDLDSASATLASLESTINAGTSARLPAAAAALVDTAETVRVTVTDIHAALVAVHRRTRATVSAINDLGTQHPEVRGASAYERALTLARAADSAVASQEDQAAEAMHDADRAAARARELSSEVAQIQNGLARADSAVQLIDSGVGHIANGVSTVSRGADALTASVRTARSAATQAHDGAQQLAGTIDSARKQLPPTDADHTAKAAKVLGSPVHITRGNLHPADEYGRGFAPFFFSIALWVFGLAAYLFLQPLNRRLLAREVPARAVTVVSWLPAVLIGAIGAALMVAISQFGLGLDPQHPVLLALLLLLALAAFVAIAQFFRVLLGTPASFAMLVLLILQLTGSGGLYPVPTTPGLLQALHPLLPMTYLIDGLRVAVSGGEMSHAVRDVAVLLGVTLASLFATGVVVRRYRSWSVSRLYPEIEG